MSKDNILQEQIAKKSAGYAAADFIQEGMIVGLGTGSTVAFFIERLIERCRDGLKISAVATSVRSETLARKGNIPILDINTISSVDMTVDGADEIDHEKRMIKGGGGALLREKIVATMSHEMVVVVDEHKVVDRLGKFPLAVEIVPFAYPSTLHRIEQLGYLGKIRMNPSGELFMTDNGNYIYDIHFKKPLNDPEELNSRLQKIVGVIETGLFLHLAGRVVVGYNNGKVKIL